VGEMLGYGGLYLGFLGGLCSTWVSVDVVVWGSLFSLGSPLPCCAGSSGAVGWPLWPYPTGSCSARTLIWALE